VEIQWVEQAELADILQFVDMTARTTEHQKERESAFNLSFIFYET
jgi:3-deoxy-D-arabino-heptulosonate 7-phosphate (DAHP) synthase